MNKLSLTGLVGVAIVGLSACADSPDSDFTTMCQNADYIRIEDSRCEPGSTYQSGSSLVYISTGSNYHAPAYYSGKVDQGQIMRSVPLGSSIQKAAIPATGGVVKNSPIIRGGLGVNGGSKSGGS